MSRITQAFKNLRANGCGGFIPFITAGDPDLRTTRALIVELARSGATLIELGVPFSDPVADGPVIQRASERALAQGVGLADVLETLADARRDTDVPVILFSYFNPLLQFGVERLAEEAARVGVDGVLATDLVPEESAEFNAALTRRRLDQIFLVAPTTSDARLRMVAAHASGFVYAVSRAGVTGARTDLSAEAARLVERVRDDDGLARRRRLRHLKSRARGRGLALRRRRGRRLRPRLRDRKARREPRSRCTRRCVRAFASALNRTASGSERVSVMRFSLSE